MPSDTQSPAAVLPIRALAYDGDAAFVVERASEPPTTAARRFRTESAPVAARVAEQVRIARDLLEGAALDASARAAVGHGLRRVVIELRELAESYDVAPVADVCRAREAGAATLDPHAVAGIEHVAHGLLGDAVPREEAGEEAREEATRDTPAPAAALPEPAAADAPEASDAAPAFRPPTGPALVELLEHGITGIERWPGTPLDVPAVPAPAAPVTAGGVVPIESLYYRGRAALARAREVRDTLRAQHGAPDPELLAELYDLVDLAAAD